MPEFSCDVDTGSAFPPCAGTLQMFTAYERIPQDLCLICFHKSDLSKLTLFSTKNLLELTSVKLV